MFSRNSISLLSTVYLNIEELEWFSCEKSMNMYLLQLEDITYLKGFNK
ncbi:unnamed protein product [Amoebophrya sp. A25]|nr:unnamed protein product [Amoebophrya sp. A25]|eukprot:GSA25T00025713001.1